MSRKSKDFQDKSFELIEFFQAHPVLAAQELLFVDMPAPQRVVFKDMWEKPFVLVSAGRGSGKCVKGDTLIPTDKGLVYLGSLGNKLEPLTDINYSVIGKDCVTKSTKWYYNGVDKVNTVKTNFGYSISSTDDHRLLALDKSGKIVWKYSSDVVEGDFLAINRNNGIWSDLDRCSLKEAELMGLIVGDGCTRGNKYSLSFTNGDKSILELFKSLIYDIFGVTASHCKSHNRCGSYQTYRKCIWDRLECLGLTNNTLAKDKFVPTSVMLSGKPVVASFMRALFECDGGCENSSVSYCTVSKRLAKEVHLLLLNFGIVSKLREKQVKYNGGYNRAFVVEITSSNIDVFSEKIGFISSRKNRSLSKLVGKKRNPNVDTVPYLENTMFYMWDKTRGHLSCDERDLLKKYKNSYYSPGYESLKKIIKIYPYNDEYKGHIKSIIESNYFYDRVVSIKTEYDHTYDLVVPETHSFVGNGFVSHNTYLLSVFSTMYAMLYPGVRVLLMSPSFRQSKLIFEEVKKRYIESPILREASLKKPVIGSDRCYLHLNGVGDRPGSAVEAYPLGTGEKVRGLRGHVILADEFAQIPQEIFDMVIRPMGATTTSPMEKVRKLEALKDKLKRGIITQEDYDLEVDGEGTNKIVGVSSAFYQFNHMYGRILSYENEISKGSDKYAVHNISYKDMPEGFLDRDNIEEAKISMSNHEFSMEYDAIWQPDSDGAFKASLIEACKDLNYNIKTEADVGKEYILGIDPARSSDAFAVVVIERGNPSYVVNAYQAVGKKFPEMAQIIFDFCEKFNVSLAMMDAGAGGGGVALKDLLANEQIFRGRLIIDMEDEDYKDIPGRRILRMHEPKPKLIAESNYAAANLLERNMLKFAKGADKFNSANERILFNIDEMLKQIISVTIEETKSGIAHFDIPATGKGSRKKDLYSAFVLAAKGLYDTVHVRDGFDYNIPGIIKPRSSIIAPPSISRISKIRGR